MAKYTIISDVGKAILSLLRDKLVPDTVDKAESIGICEPRERGGYIVGIHPYDIKEDTSGTAKEPTTLADGSVQDPPAMIEINYVVSVSSKAELESKALDEAKIMGKIIQIFKDNPTIPSRYMPNNAGMPVESIPISMLPLNMEEKVKVWTMFGESYKLSVFYVVGPVAIDSGNIHKPKKRVESFYLGSKHFENKKEIRFATFIKEEDIDDEYTHRPDEDEEESEDEYSDDSSGGDESSEDTSYGSDDGLDNDDSDLSEDNETSEENTEETSEENTEETSEENTEETSDDDFGDLESNNEIDSNFGDDFGSDSEAEEGKAEEPSTEEVTFESPGE